MATWPPRPRCRSSSRATRPWEEGSQMRDGERRVVVTGMGALTPVGNDVPAFWDGLVNARSGIDRISLFDPARVASKVAGEIKGFDADTVMPKKEVRRNDR